MKKFNFNKDNNTSQGNRFIKYIFIISLVLFGFSLFFVNTSKAWDSSILEHWNYDTSYNGEILEIPMDDNLGKTLDEMYLGSYALKTDYSSWDNQFTNQFEFTQGLSINSWFNFKDNGYAPYLQYIVEDSDGGLFGFDFQPLSGRYTFRSVNFENNFSSLSPLTQIANSFPSDLIDYDEWHMMTIILDTQKFYIYIDNVLYGEWAFSSNLDFSVINNMNFWIRTPNGYSLEDEKTLFDKSLSADDVDWLFNLGCPLASDDYIGTPPTPVVNYSYDNLLSFQSEYNINASSTALIYYNYNRQYIPILTNEINIYDFELAEANWLIDSYTIEDYNNIAGKKQNGNSYFAYSNPKNVGSTTYLYAGYIDFDGIEQLIPIKINTLGIDIKKDTADYLANIAEFNASTSSSTVINEFLQFDVGSMVCSEEEWLSPNVEVLGIDIGFSWRGWYCGVKALSVNTTVSFLNFLQNTIGLIKDEVLNVFPFNIPNKFLETWKNAEISKFINPFYIPIVYASSEVNIEDLIPIPVNGEGFEFKVNNFSGDKSLSFKIFNRQAIVDLIGENLMLLIRSMIGFSLYVLLFIYLFVRITKLRF